MCVDKVHNVYLYIRDSIMAWHVEMMPDSIFLIADADVVEVALETVHQSPLGLSNVLHVAVLARDAVYNITAFAVHTDFAGVFSVCY